VLTDPAPLTRPLRRRDLDLALAAVDTAALQPGERRLLARARAELRDRERGAAWRLEGHAGLAVASHSRRDPLRAAGPDMATASGGLGLDLRLGQVVAVTHPYFDTRLRRDPDYRGKKDRALAGRNAAAYIDAQWRLGEVFFGQIDRNWGPPAVPGLLLSTAPYSYDHLALGLGTSSIRIDAVLTQLDDLTDSAGDVNHRYYITHRLMLRPRGPTTIALWEGTLLAGPARTLEPWYANILNLGLLGQYDQGASANNQLGFDIETRIARTQVFGSVLIDDIQVDRSSAGDREPTSYGLTLGARGGLGRAAWTAYYTRVSNLAYRTPNPMETVMRRGVGLARDFSDYDQLTAHLTVVVGPGVLVTPEVTGLRQGEGDFRRPFPAVAQYDSTPAFLAGVVERTLRLAVGVQAVARRLALRGDAGVHFVTNAGHVQGSSDTRFVGSVTLEYRFAWSNVLP
jgi:hypothetical protein